MSDSSGRVNIAYLLEDWARRYPRGQAVVESCAYDSVGRAAYSHLSFSRLDELSDAMAWALSDFGIRRG